MDVKGFLKNIVKPITGGRKIVLSVVETVFRGRDRKDAENGGAYAAVGLRHGIDVVLEIMQQVEDVQVFCRDIGNGEISNAEKHVRLKPRVVQTLRRLLRGVKLDEAYLEEAADHAIRMAVALDNAIDKDEIREEDE